MPRGRPKKNTDDVLMKSAEVIGWALGGIEREISMTRERLASLTAQASSLRSRLSGAGASPAAQPSGTDADPGAKGNRKRRRRKRSGAAGEAAAPEVVEAVAVTEAGEDSEETSPEEPTPAPKRTRSRRKAVSVDPDTAEPP